MAFESLSEKLSAAFKRLRSKGKLNEADIKTAMREVRMALLEADVNYKVAKDFVAKVSERAVGQAVMESLTPAQMVDHIVPINKGGAPLDLNNLQSLCNACHAAKSAKDK